MKNSIKAIEVLKSVSFEDLEDTTCRSIWGNRGKASWLNDQLFNLLVPAEGPADTEAGELVRCLNRLGYRFFNDGDMMYYTPVDCYVDYYDDEEDDDYEEEEPEECPTDAEPFARIIRERFPALENEVEALYDRSWSEERYEEALDVLYQAAFFLLKEKAETCPAFFE